MSKERHEVDFYEEIQDFVEKQMKSTFMAAGIALDCFFDCRNGMTLDDRLKQIIAAHGLKSPELVRLAEMAPALLLDIFALITDGTHGELLFLEIKSRKTFGLSELSQLIGYCIAADARFGLLVNVDEEESPQFASLLVSRPGLTHIKRLASQLNEDGSVQEIHIEHSLGVMIWSRETKSMECTGYGAVTTLSQLCEEIALRFKQEKKAVLDGCIP